MGIEIVGYIVLAWFAGVIGADMAQPKIKVRQSGETIYQYKEVDGKKAIVNYKAHGFSSCRPQCYMSGSFYDGVVRPMVPWPFRKGRFYECAKEGELDYCTGEVFIDGKWSFKNENK